jgi:response regulator RpfG family c-di-GMP phosphodiesterase
MLVEQAFHIKFTPTILMVSEFFDVELITSTDLVNECRLVFATNREEVLKFSGVGNPPDLIFLDYVMFSSGCYEICRLFRGGAGAQNIPVILILAEHDVLNLDANFEYGLIDLIRKPIKFSDVVSQARSFTALRQSKLYLESVLDRLHEIVVSREQTFVRDCKSNVHGIYNELVCFRSVFHSHMCNLEGETGVVYELLQHMELLLDKAIKAAIDIDITLRPIVFDLGVIAALKLQLNDLTNFSNTNCKKYIERLFSRLNRCRYVH